MTQCAIPAAVVTLPLQGKPYIALACRTYEEQQALAAWLERDPSIMAALKTLVGWPPDLRAEAPDGRAREAA